MRRKHKRGCLLIEKHAGFCRTHTPLVREARVGGPTRKSTRRRRHKTPLGELTTKERTAVGDLRGKIMQRTAEKDNVNHPSHYGGDVPYEHVKVARAWHLTSDAFLYNATKYIARVGIGGKGSDPLEDLKKAAWYLAQAIEERAT